MSRVQRRIHSEVVDHNKKQDRAKFSALRDPSMGRHPIRNKVVKFHGLTSITKEATDPTNQEATYAEVDKLLYKNIIIYVLECLAKIHKTHSKVFARLVNWRKPVMDHA